MTHGNNEPFELEAMIALRQDLHAHPELGFEELRTSQIVAEQLEAAGIEVHRGMGITGVVGTLRVGDGDRSIALRADMDALAMPELGDVQYKSGTANTMHACGHDGHTVMLLAAARHLARTRQFSGTVHFIFQPAEEGRGGAKAMIDDGSSTVSQSTPSIACTTCRGWRWMRWPSLRGRNWRRRTVGRSPFMVSALMGPSRIWGEMP
ncbi:amidohydrolase [Devosia psychrophila]|uniref:Amidohydrolase n=1 Tax=Devosia psychrophila TaxID=728005 RepID=A0A1I1KUZ8_9HYPH|nr:amidohydrolase [Devosia psychrophila]